MTREGEGEEAWNERGVSLLFLFLFRLSEVVPSRQEMLCVRWDKFKSAYLVSWRNLTLNLI
jgi:hypothetical protein